jgi:hypothetical protein
VGAGAQHLPYLVGTFAQHQRVGSDHAELHGIGHGRAVGQQLDATAHLGELLRQNLRHALAQGLARLDVLGQHDHLRHVGLGDHLIQRQIEARHTGTTQC